MRSIDYLAIPNSTGTIKELPLSALHDELNRSLVRNILILDGQDSKEDILNLGALVEPGDIVAIDTFALHFAKYELLIQKAISDGKFPHGATVELIEIPEDLHLLLYGSLGLLEEALKHRNLMYKRYRRERWLENIKEFVHRFIPL